jgi:hypothetical protein
MTLPFQPIPDDQPASPDEDRPPPPAAQTIAIGAKAEPEILPPEPKTTPRELPLSKKLKRAVAHIADGCNISDAARLSGMHRRGLTDALRRPKVLAHLEQTIKTNLAAAAGKAATRLGHLIDGAKSEYVQLEAAKAVLDRSGYAQQSNQALSGDVLISIQL